MIHAMRVTKSWILPLFVLPLIFAAGCGSERTQTTAALNDDDLAILAGLAEGAGSAQTAVEIIPVPAATTVAEEAALEAGAGPGVEVEMSLAAVEETGEEVASVIPPVNEELPFEEKVQIALANAQFYQGDIDGRVGPKTREAIRSFQRVHGLKVDGMAGRRTWAKLKEYYYPEPDSVE